MSAVAPAFAEERLVPKGPRITLVPFAEIRLSGRRRYLIGGMIPRPGLTVVWGPPKSGKSFIVFDAAMHVALGRQYRGRRVEQGPVVYCAFEGQSGIEARVEAFRQRFMAEDPGEVPFFLEPVTLDLVREQADLTAAIRRQLGAASPVLVVLDTLNRSFNGSESSDEDMTAYVRAADAIREQFDCAVVIVHHCGIEGTRPRGHTSLTGAADAQIAVRRDGQGNVVAELELAKDGPSGDTLVSRLEVVEVGQDEDGEPITSCVVVASNAEPKDRGRSPSRLKPAAQKVVAAFGRLFDEGRTCPAPMAPGVPTGTRAVMLSDLKDKALELGLFGDPEPPAEDKAGRTKWRNSSNTAWRRALTEVEQRGRLRSEAGLVWELGAPVLAMTNEDSER